jgi:hypothetical protein
MLPRRRGSRTVTCIACGCEVPRPEAREYDKYGDRWEREGKQFEYLCKPCFGELSRDDRSGPESLLVDLSAGRIDREEFLTRYTDAIEEEAESE